ncbi:MAG: metallophosphoesterase family protein [Bradymonadaceae bacterium]
MKFLHTSDWHLGVTMQGAACEEEQQRFLDWLIETIIDGEIDVLLVAGDIFHREQPPARSLRIYYRFLARCAAETNLEQVVIVGGNHDSPTQLEAPAEILLAMNVHVVGGLRADEHMWEQCLCPIENPETGEVDAVVVAVPYVQEAKLGIITTSSTGAEIRRQYTERFTHLYRTLAELAVERYPNVPLIATGHLTCESASSPVERTDFHEDIHQVGTISGLPPSIFSEHYDYIALGHIHRMFPIGDSRAWYCGTPVATSRNETTTRFVLVANTNERDESGALVVEKIKVPRWREVHALKGTQEEISDAIRSLPQKPELAPYLFIDAEVESIDQSYEVRARFDRLIKETFEEGHWPRIVECREYLESARRSHDEERPGGEFLPLKDLSPEEVFSLMFAEADGGRLPGDDYLVAFRYLLETRQSQDYDATCAPMFGDDTKNEAREEAQVKAKHEEEVP